VKVPSLAQKQAAMRKRWRNGQPTTPIKKWWKWKCPTCQRSGFKRGEKPTFSRCWHCDSEAPHGFVPLRLEITEI